MGKGIGQYDDTGKIQKYKMKFVAKIKMKNSKIPETRKVKNAGSEYKKMAGEINDKVGEEHIKWRESEENGTTARNALANNRNWPQNWRQRHPTCAAKL